MQMVWMMKATGTKRQSWKTLPPNVKSSSRTTQHERTKAWDHRSKCRRTSSWRSRGADRTSRVFWRMQRWALRMGVCRSTVRLSFPSLRSELNAGMWEYGNTGCSLWSAEPHGPCPAMSAIVGVWGYECVEGWSEYRFARRGVWLCGEWPWISTTHS